MTDTREAILAAAEEIFGRDGLSGLTIRRVAGAVGLSPMAIYRHFAGKGALLDALVNLGFARWEERLTAAAGAGHAPRTRLENAIRAYRDFALAESRLFALMFVTPRPGIPEAPASLGTTPSPGFGQVIGAVIDEIRAGSLPEEDPAQLILLIWSTAHGLISLHFTGRFGHDTAAFCGAYDRTVAALLDHLRRSTSWEAEAGGSSGRGESGKSGTHRHARPAL